MADRTINFKDPLRMIAWLDTALKKEKEKYKKCPVIPDLVPGHEVAQAWGYVVYRWEGVKLGNASSTSTLAQWGSYGALAALERS